MRFMIIRKADRETEAWAKPSKALVDAMMAYNEEMIRAGVMLGGDGLKRPVEEFARVIRSAGADVVELGGALVRRVEVEDRFRPFIDCVESENYKRKIDRLKVKDHRREVCCGENYIEV